MRPRYRISKAKTQCRTREANADGKVDLDILRQSFGAVALFAVLLTAVPAAAGDAPQWCSNDDVFPGLYESEEPVVACAVKDDPDRFFRELLTERERRALVAHLRRDHPDLSYRAFLDWLDPDAD